MVTNIAIKNSIGIDIGGTKIAAVLLDNASGKELFSYRTNTPKNYPDFLKSVIDVINKISLHASSDFYIGIGIPGLVFPNRQVLNYNNLPFIKPDFIFDLEKEIKHQVFISNDANCFAFSEYIDGSAKGYNSAFCLIIGTGVGGGIVINNRIISGPNAFTGEIGHTSIPFPTQEENNTPCTCGSKGCIESLLSGPALISQYEKASGLSMSSAEEIVIAANNKDITAQRVLNIFYDRLARCFLNFIYLFDPEVIVLGGGLSEISEIYTEVPKILTTYMEALTPTKKINLNIRKATHGSASGVRGAAWLWKTF